MTEPAVVRIHPADDVVIARRRLVGGMRLDAEGITVIGLVPPGHKLAVRAIAQGEPVRRYNQIIGTATQPIAAGQRGDNSSDATPGYFRRYSLAQIRSSSAAMSSAGAPSSVLRPRCWSRPKSCCFSTA